jgi:hypothetical protein
MSDLARPPDSEARLNGSGSADRPRLQRPAGGRDRERADAQRRVNRIRAFRAELDALTEVGAAALTPEQRESITQYHEALLQRLAAQHDVDRTEAASQLSRGMQIASFFAAIALTAAVYSLVARFWGRLDLPVQATLLGAFPLIALIGVELAAERERTLYISSIFALVATGTYWLAVIVLSELLSVPVTPPAFWGGALFGLALALPYGFRLILAASLIAFIAALSGSIFAAAGSPWTAAAEFPEVATAEAFLLLIVAPWLGAAHASFAPITRGVALSVGFLGLLVLSVSGRASLLPFPAAATEIGYQAVMLVACVAIMVAGIKRQQLETVYIAAGALSLFLLGRFVDWFWDLLPRFVFFLLLAAIAFAWLLALRRLRARVA